MQDRHELRCVLGGVALPLVCFVIDPLFITDASLGADLADGWLPRLMPLAAPGSIEALLVYSWLTLMLVSMTLHLVVPPEQGGAWLLAGLMIGIPFCLFFSVAILPAALVSLFLLPVVVPTVLCWAPMIALWVYAGAVRERIRHQTARRPVLAAVALAALPLIPFVHHALQARALERARRPSEIAAAIEGLQRYGEIARRDVRRVHAASEPPRQRRLRALYRELAGEPLFDDALTGVEDGGRRR